MIVNCRSVHRRCMWKRTLLLGRRMCLAVFLSIRAVLSALSRPLPTGEAFPNSLSLVFRIEASPVLDAAACRKHARSQVGVSGVLARVACMIVKRTSVLISRFCGGKPSLHETILIKPSPNRHPPEERVETSWPKTFRSELPLEVRRIEPAERSCMLDALAVRQIEPPERSCLPLP